MLSPRCPGHRRMSRGEESGPRVLQSLCYTLHWVTLVRGLHSLGNDPMSQQILIVPTCPHPGPRDSHPVPIRHCPHSLFSRQGLRDPPLNHPLTPCPRIIQVPNRRLSVFLAPGLYWSPPLSKHLIRSPLSLVVSFVVVKFLELCRTQSRDYSYNSTNQTETGNLTSNLCESCILTSSFDQTLSDNNFLDPAANFNLMSFVRVWVIVKTQIIDSSLATKMNLKITVKARQF